MDNLLVRIHCIIEMIWRTGLAPWEFECSFPGSRMSTFLGLCSKFIHRVKSLFPVQDLYQERTKAGDVRSPWSKFIHRVRSLFSLQDLY